jgi:NADPH:quinone reductase-like Zn-dependent oxidoreductase
LAPHRPTSLSADEAAAPVTVGLTVRAIAATAKVPPGERVLVVGATGGVGAALVPLLAAARTHVIATATAADAGVLRGLGAEEVIGYRERDYPVDVDVAVNVVLPGDRLAGVARALRPGRCLDGVPCRISRSPRCRLT